MNYPVPPQQYQPPYPQQQFPQQGYPQQAPQGYYSNQTQPQQAPRPVPAQGTLDEFFNQPSTGGGPAVSWTDKATNQPKQIGSFVEGYVARDVAQGDIQQETTPQGQLKTFADGRPKFVMKVPLKVQPSQEFPDGEAVWFVKGQGRDELTRAMAEAGQSGAPKAGAYLKVTLVARRASRTPGFQPTNMVQVAYAAPQGSNPPVGPAGTGPEAPVNPQWTPAPQEMPQPAVTQQHEQGQQLWANAPTRPDAQQPAPPVAQNGAWTQVPPPGFPPPPQQPQQHYPTTAPTQSPEAPGATLPEGFGDDQKAILERLLAEKKAAG